MRESVSCIIADDDEFFRRALGSALLKELQFRSVKDVANFRDAFDLLEQNPDTDLVLFDLNMPGLRGMEDLKLVRAQFPNVLVAVISGSGRREDFISALQVGLHGFIAKSLGVKEILRAIGTILNGEIFVPWSISATDAAETTPAPTASSPQIDPSLPLTPRQKHVLELLCRGQSNKEIARSLDLGEGTVKVHVAALFKQLGVNSRSAAVAAAVPYLKTRFPEK